MSEKEIQSRRDYGSVDISELVNPFPGLRPFGIEESHLFFGREGQSDEVLMKLSENKFVAILGASGSGKSSLMYCGLIPTLYGGFMTDAGSNWRIVVTRPGGGPIDNLAESLLVKDKVYNELDDEEQLIRKTITSTVLRSSSLGLIEAVKQLKSSEYENVLILVDQFEELFRYKKLETLSSDLDESSAFVNLLLEAVHQYDAPIYVALTMRSDFIGDCASFPDLTQMINDSHYLIPQMTRDQKRLAVEGPVAVGGGKIAPRLTQQLLNDVGDNPDQLPILQHALMRTWQFWTENRKEDEPIDLRHYNAIGTLREALSQHANEAFDSLSKREQQICEVMFKALTERGTESSGIRRPTKLSTIAAIAGVNEEEVIRVVDKFREPGRTLLMPPYGVRLESDTVIDISHESLMRIWTRLKSWLDEESRASEMYLKLAESAERFQLGRAGLWKMPDLQLALNWQEENKPTLVWGQRYEPAFERTMVFLETSKKAYETEQRNKELLQKRALRRSRIAALFLAAAALVSIFFVVLAQIQASEAKKQTQAAILAQEEAKKNAERADQQAKRAEKLAAEAVQAQTAAEKAKEDALAAAEQARAAEAKALVQQKIAEENAEEARKATELATQNAEKARKAQEEAQASAERAQEEQRKAQRLRYQAIAQSMAIKSSSVNDEQERGLIARQAYLFHNKYGDKEYNADVYIGVYDAMKELLAPDEPTQGDSITNHYKAHTEAVRSVVYADEGRKMYSAGSDGRVILWDMEANKDVFAKTSERPYKIIIDNDYVNRVVDISPDEQWLAVGSDDEKILLYNLNSTASEPTEITGYYGVVFDLVFLPDNSGFVYATGDGVIRLNDFTKNTTVAKVSSRVKALAISPDGKKLAGGNVAGNVLIWDMENDFEEKSIYVRNGKPINALSFSNDNKTLVFGDEEGMIVVWNLEEKTIEKQLTQHSAKITDLQFNQNNSLLASTSFDGTARIWTMENLNDLPTKLTDFGGGTGSTKWVWAVNFSPDNEHLVTGSGDGNIRYWPIKPDEMAVDICGYLTANMTNDTWEAYVGEDIDYEKTCDGLPQPDFE